MSDKWVLPICVSLVVGLAICLIAVIVIEIKLEKIKKQAEYILGCKIEKETYGLEFNKWYPIDVYYKNKDKLDWAIVQFIDELHDFTPLPIIAEFSKKDKLWYDTLGNKIEYMAIAFMLWKPVDNKIIDEAFVKLWEMKKNGIND